MLSSRPCTAWPRVTKMERETSSESSDAEGQLSEWSTEEQPRATGSSFGDLMSRERDSDSSTESSEEEEAAPEEEAKTTKPTSTPAAPSEGERIFTCRHSGEVLLKADFVGRPVSYMDAALARHIGGKCTSGFR